MIPVKTPRLFTNRAQRNILKKLFFFLSFFVVVVAAWSWLRSISTPLASVPWKKSVMETLSSQGTQNCVTPKKATGKGSSNHKPKVLLSTKTLTPPHAVSWNLLPTLNPVRGFCRSLLQIVLILWNIDVLFNEWRLISHWDNYVGKDLILRLRVCFQPWGTTLVIGSVLRRAAGVLARTCVLPAETTAGMGAVLTPATSWRGKWGIWVSKASDTQPSSFYSNQESQHQIFVYPSVPSCKVCLCRLTLDAFGDF